MSKTITEKIVSRASGKDVSAGDYLEVLPLDHVYFNEVIGPPALIDFEKDFGETFRELGCQLSVFDSSRITMFPDHTVPSSSEKVSEGITLMKRFSSAQNIKIFKQGDGIEHTVASEKGIVKPGDVVVATDSHTCTQGALGSLAFGIGTREAEYALANGELYSFNVPETIRFDIEGSPGPGVYAKDLILHILGIMGEGGCSGRIAEFTGGCMDGINMDGRFTMCNLCVEMGARSGIVNPDGKTMQYTAEALNSEGRRWTDEDSAKVMKSDAEAAYFRTVEVDASKIEPTVSLPHSPANARPVSEVDDEIDNVFIGSCANARKEDLTVVASILKGRHVHPTVNLIVIPASRKVYNWAVETGIMSILASAGANIESSNCGPCFGKHMGVLSEGQRCLSTSNRNYRGRMGSEKAFIYLSSPAVAAASAIDGRITDPRKYLGRGQ